MQDENIIDRINQLAHEEHELFERESRGKADQADRERLSGYGAGVDGSAVTTTGPRFDGAA